MSQYLERLSFQQKDEQSLIARYLSNIRIGAILLIAIVFLGMAALTTLPKTLMPEVDLPAFFITTTLPGGSPEDLEKMVTQPLEQELKKINDIDEYNSTSQENISLISVQFGTEADSNQARDELQSALDSAASELPSDAQTSTLTQIDFENIPVQVFALSKQNCKQNQTVDTASLMRLSTQLKEKLEEQSLLSRVETSGFDQRVVNITIRPEFIQDHQVNLQTLSQAIKNSLQSYPAGKVTNHSTDFSVVINQPVSTISDLRQLYVTFRGQDYRLTELAQVSFQSELDQASSFLIKPNSGQTASQNSIQPIVVFYVYKTADARLDQASQQTQQIVDSILQPYQGLYQTVSIENYSQQVNQEISGLMDNLIQTLLLVFASMLLLYGLKQSLVASASIPLSIFIILLVMKVYDFSINFLSIYSLLIALGLFTDNAVVVIEGFTSIYQSDKFTPWQAAVLTFKDYALELLVINLMTCWSFLPMIIMPGIIGEFIKPMPILVSVAMMASVFVALFLTLPSMMLVLDFSPPPRVKILGLGLSAFSLVAGFAYLVRHSSLAFVTVLVFALLMFSSYLLRHALWQRARSLISQLKHTSARLKQLSQAIKHGFISLQSLLSTYQQLLARILQNKVRRRQIVLAVILVLVFALALLPLGFVENQFFPKTQAEKIYLELELPDGTNKKIASRTSQQLLQQLQDKTYAQHIVAEVAAEYNTGFSISQAQGNQILLTIFLTEENERELNSFQITDQLRQQYQDYEQAKVTVTAEQTGGPPTGADIEVTLTGSELAKLKTLSDQVKQYLATQPGANNIEADMKTGVSKLAFNPRQEKLNYYGLNEAGIGFHLRTMLNGTTVDSLNIDGQDYDLVLRLQQDMVQPAALTTLTIPSQKHGYIPLGELGDFKLESNPTIINHQDGQRAVTITATALPGFNATTINKSLDKFIQNELDLPPNYEWSAGGSNEANQEASQSIIVAMGISFLLLMVTLVLQLQSFRKALLVLLAVPIAVSGVLIAFALFAIPLSLPAMMGLLSLFGIVIANSLMIVTKIDKNLAIGLEFEQAIVEGATSRLEPIILTSSSQIIGLIPATLADAVWRGFGGAIIFGLSYSAVLMLFFIPIFYWLLMKKSRD